MPSITIALSDDHYRVLREFAQSVAYDDYAPAVEQVAEVILLQSCEVTTLIAADKVADRLVDELGEHFRGSTGSLDPSHSGVNE